MREDVEGDRVGINLRHRLATVHGCFDLPPEFFDRTRTAAGDSLITGGEDAAQTERAVQRIERHQRDGGCAIRIRNHPTMPADVPGIDFRDDQRDVDIHPEGRRVIDYDCAGPSCDGRELRCRPRAGAEKSEVNAGEGILPERRRLKNPVRETPIFSRQNATRPAAANPRPENHAVP